MNSRLETLILANLIHNEDYTRKVLPFIDSDYFHNRSEKILFQQIEKYINEYDDCPSIKILEVLIGEVKMNESEYEEMENIFDSIEETEKQNLEWLVDQTEKFCKEKAIYNAIFNSIDILENKKTEYTVDAIPELLSQALSVGFNLSLGHDYFEDAEQRFDKLLNDEEKIPFDIDILNKITNGGLFKKTLTVLLAGCVHPDTKIKININDVVADIKISEVEQLIQKFDVFVYSPDGWVKILKYVHKGNFEEYILSLENGKTVSVNENHLFETPLGWQLTKDIHKLNEPQHFLTKDGYVLGFIEKTGLIIPIVDIEVDHINHRYYTNGVSSHNTGIGKSLTMCHFAKHHIEIGKNVLYITCEMAEEKIANRLDANLLDVDINKLEQLGKKSFLGKIQQIQSKGYGKLIVEEFPPVSAHSGHFKMLINELKMKRKFVPDVIYVDYLNICLSRRFKSSSSGNNSYSYIKSISEELRALAVEFDCPLITATQVNRAGHGSNDLELDDVSESFAITFVADLFLSISTTEQLNKMQQIMFKQLKNRYNDLDYYKRFCVGIDKPKMRLYNLESDGNIPDEKVEESNKPVFNSFKKQKNRNFSNININKNG